MAVIADNKPGTDQKRLSFALEFVVSTFPKRRRGGQNFWTNSAVTQNLRLPS